MIRGTFSKPSIKLNTDEVVKNAVTDDCFGSFAVDAEDIEAQKARKQAEEAGNKLIATAKSESEKLISKASNPLAKLQLRQPVRNWWKKQRNKLRS